MKKILLAVLIAVYSLSVAPLLGAAEDAKKQALADLHHNLSEAVADNNRSEVEQLLYTWDNKNGLNWGIPLHIAACLGHAGAVDFLLRNNVDKDARNDFGETSLHFAARYGHASVVELLLAAGANKDVCDEDGWTPLYSAVWHGHVSVIELLFAAGVDKDAPDSRGWTSLQRAVFWMACRRV